MVDIRQMMRAEKARRRAAAEAAEAATGSTGTPSAQKKRKTGATDCNGDAITVCGDSGDRSATSAGTDVTGGIESDADMPSTDELASLVAVGSSTATSNAIDSYGGGGGIASINRDVSTAPLGLNSYSDDEDGDTAGKGYELMKNSLKHIVSAEATAGPSRSSGEGDTSWAEAIEHEETGSRVVETFEVIEPPQDLLNIPRNRKSKSQNHTTTGGHVSTHAPTNDERMLVDTTGTLQNTTGTLQNTTGTLQNTT
eukprot:Lankesteria_metandrocarpae@DN6239_c0_g1_i1.p1